MLNHHLPSCQLGLGSVNVNQHSSKFKKKKKKKTSLGTWVLFSLVLFLDKPQCLFLNCVNCNTEVCFVATVKGFVLLVLFCEVHLL